MTAKIPAKQLAAIAEAARLALWRQGDLSWKLDRGDLQGPQRDIYEASKASLGKTFVTEASRRLGKTFVHALIAVELCLQNPGARINWCQSTAKSVRDMAVPLFDVLMADAPAECRGVFNDRRSAIEFPNGAFIFLFGADSQEDADRARGGVDPLASFFDEAAFSPHLEYVYRSLLKPGMRLVRRVAGTHQGLIFLFSSTPYAPSHYFCTVADLNSLKGSYCRQTIYATPNAEAYIAEEAADLGLTVESFKATTQFKREFLCERVVDTEAVVFPEFHLHRESVVKAWERPIGFDRYIYRRVAADLGMVDKTGLLFGYVDFTAGKVVIEAELLLNRPTTKQIAEAMTSTEAELWPNANPSRVSRVIDDPQGRVVLDLWDLHRLRVEKATKDNRLASIGLIRTWLQSGVLVISPACTELQKQLLEALNTKNGKDFQRTDDGHSDLCAALMYFVRGLSLTQNPYPPDFDVLQGRELPAHHPLMARRETLNRGKPKNLSEALLSGNRFVKGLKR